MAASDAPRLDGPYTPRAIQPTLRLQMEALSPSGSPRNGSPSSPIRPVSARTWGRMKEPVKMYSNDLFRSKAAVPGQVPGGDILALEDAEVPGASRAPGGLSKSPSRKLEHQRSLAAERRKQRLQGGGAEMNPDMIAGGQAGLSRMGTIGSTSKSAGLAAKAVKGSTDGSAAAEPAQPAAQAALQPSALQKQPQQEEKPSHKAPVPVEAASATSAASKLKERGLREVYDPMADDSSAHTHRNSSDTGAVVQQSSPSTATPRPTPASISTSDIEQLLADPRAFLSLPAPRGGPVMCFIQRSKGKAMSSTAYKLFLEDGQRFLLYAKKMRSKTSNYLISLSQDDSRKESGTYFGKVRSNFVGTEFVVFDNGTNPSKASTVLDMRCEMGAVLYQYNIMGTRGPRKMTCLVPKVHDDDEREVFRPSGGEDKGILDHFKARQRLQDILMLKNKPPKWNDQLGAYCLNFNGRVTHASVKNFQLVTDDDHDHIMLQFGKVGKDLFTMDYQWPLSGLQAFGICLTSFDNKLACE